MKKRNLILAFDDSCYRCKRLSQRIKQATAGLLETIPLRSVEAQKLRAQTLGEGAPWQPTLIRISSHSTQSWIGPRMGPVLFRELGPVKTAAVLKTLGIENRTFGLHAPTEEIAPSFTRRGFMQISAGVAAGVALAFGGGLREPGKAKAESLPSVKLSNDLASTSDTLREVLDSHDAINVLKSAERENLSRATIIENPNLGPDCFFARYSPMGLTEFNNATLSGTGYVIRQSYEGYDRARIRTVAVYLGPDANRFLSFRITAVRQRAPVHEAEVFQLHSDSTITSLAHSAGGVMSVPFPDGHDQHESSHQPLQAFDPCGSCTTEPYYERGTCHTDDALSCVLSGIGCGLCATSCYGLGPACLACVIASCGSALRSCCQREGGSICAAYID